MGGAEALLYEDTEEIVEKEGEVEKEEKEEKPKTKPNKDWFQ
jgi:hypothetical protein